MERVSSNNFVLNEQDIKTFGDVIALSIYNFFNNQHHLPEYWVKEDKVFNGDCGLQAVAIAIDCPLSLYSLRLLMVNLILQANIMTDEKSSPEEKITAMLAIFNNNLGNFKQYFLNIIADILIDEDTAPEMRINQTIIMDLIQEAKSKEDIIGNHILLNHLLQTGIEIEYRLIAEEHHYGANFEHLQNHMSTTGSWLPLDAIKLLMLYHGYSISKVEDCKIARYQELTNKIISFRNINNEEYIKYIANIGQNINPSGIHWACCTKNENDFGVTKEKMLIKLNRNRQIVNIKNKSLPYEVIEIEDDEDEFNEIFLDNTSSYSALLDILDIHYDLGQVILNQFEPLFKRFIYNGFEDEDFSSLLLMIPSQSQGSADLLYDYLESFIAIVEKRKLKYLEIEHPLRKKLKQYEIMTAPDIIRIIENSKDPLYALEGIYLLQKEWHSLITFVAKSFNSIDFQEIGTNLSTLLTSSGDLSRSNMKKCINMTKELINTLAPLGFSQDAFFVLLEDLEGMSFSRKIRELSVIYTNYNVIKDMLQKYGIHPVTAVKLFYKKRYSNNLISVGRNLEIINQILSNLFAQYIKEYPHTAIDKNDFSNQILQQVVTIMEDDPADITNLSTAQAIIHILNNVPKSAFLTEIFDFHS